MEPEARDLAEVLGQETAKRALEVAAAGGHPILLFGPPGSGKTMLAERLPGLLPPVSEREAAEIAEIYSMSRDAGGPPKGRPVRRPPPSTTATAMTGGGRALQPGEVSLAHQGILFLDELASFRRETLNVLRQPLVDGQVAVGHGLRSRSFSARFLLIATLNPCPCGWHDDGRHPCRCTPAGIARHLQALSGALLDRIDLLVSVTSLSLQESRSGAGEGSGTVARRVSAARSAQWAERGGLNTDLAPAVLRLHGALDAKGKALLEAATAKLGLSARGRTGLVKVARTLADLAGSEAIRPSHLAEAVQYRQWPLP